MKTKYMTFFSQFCAICFPAETVIIYADNLFLKIFTGIPFFLFSDCLFWICPFDILYKWPLCFVFYSPIPKNDLLYLPLFFQFSQLLLNVRELVD